MMESLSPPVRRLVALALLAAVILAVWGYVVAPVVAGYREAAESIAQSRQQLAQYRRIAARAPQLQAELDRLRQGELSRVGLLEGDKDTLVVAELQNRIKTLAEASGGELRSLQALPVRDEEHLRQITVRAHLSFGEEGLLQVLHALESSRPYLFIDNVDVRSRTTRPRRAPNQPEAPAGIALEARFDVIGYMRGRTP
jgi:general secretion pathway protein M